MFIDAKQIKYLTSNQGACYQTVGITELSAPIMIRLGDILLTRIFHILVERQLIGLFS